MKQLKKHGIQGRKNNCDFLETKSHSSLKYRMLGLYFSIWRSLLKGEKRPLYYIDLYCGDGETFDESTGDRFETPFVKCLMRDGVIKGNLNIKFILNDIDSKKIDKLKAKINEIGVSQNIIDITDKNANEYVDDALSKIPNNEFTIFFLDPFNYNDIKWATIEKIANHKNKAWKKPEMIINLPLYPLGKGLETAMKTGDYDAMNEFFGTDIWLERVNEYKGRGLERPVFTAFKDVYVEQLQKLGYGVQYEDINSIGNNAPLYYLIFAVSNPKAYKIVKSALAFAHGVKQKWIEEKENKHTKIDVVGKGSGLEKWMK